MPSSNAAATFVPESSAMNASSALTPKCSRARGRPAPPACARPDRSSRDDSRRRWPPHPEPAAEAPRRTAPDYWRTRPPHRGCGPFKAATLPGIGVLAFSRASRHWSTVNATPVTSSPFLEIFGPGAPFAPLRARLIPCRPPAFREMILTRPDRLRQRRQSLTEVVPVQRLIEVEQVEVHDARIGWLAIWRPFTTARTAPSF